MKCHKCSARLPRKANYCPNCGKSVTGDEECIKETLKLKNPETRGVISIVFSYVFMRTGINRRLS